MKNVVGFKELHNILYVTHLDSWKEPLTIHLPILFQAVFIFIRKNTSVWNLDNSPPFQFDNRPGLSRRDVIKESIQVANIADLVSELSDKQLELLLSKTSSDYDQLLSKTSELKPKRQERMII